MQHIVQAESAAQFLTALPAITGYRVTNSIVVVAFVGRRTAGAFRLDLPSRRRTSDYRAVVTRIVGMLAKMPRVDRIAPVIYTDATFEEERGIPWLELSRLLLQRVHDQGFHLTGAFCVAGDGWGDYLDRGDARKAHPLAELRDDRILNELGRAELGRAEVPWVGELGALPEPTPEQVDEFGRLLDELERGVHDRELAQLADRCAVCWVELCVGWPEGTLPRLALGHLLELAQTPALRDAMMLQMAFGEEIGVCALENADAFLDDRKRSGETAAEWARRQLASGGNGLLDTLILGDSTTRPDVDRVMRGIELLGTAVSLAPDDLKPAPLCMLAWLSWSLGRGSAAGAYLGTALDLDPDYGMAQVLSALVASRLPEWAYGGPE